LEVKRTLDAIKIARIVLHEQRDNLELMALSKNHGTAPVAMAALLFLEALAAHSVVAIDLPNGARLP
jgi:hypothetical protein